MRPLASAGTFRALLPPWLFLEALEIAGAIALGRYCSTRVTAALRTYPAHRPRVNATLKIVRFIIAYMAVLTMLWALEFSTLSFSHEIAVVILGAFVAGSALDGRGPVVTAVCGRCGKPMTQLADTPAAVVFGCHCGATISAPK